LIFLLSFYVVSNFLFSHLKFCHKLLELNEFIYWLGYDL
jgi:uncharacterized membrane protein